MSEDLAPRGRDGRDLEERVGKLEDAVAKMAAAIAELAESAAPRDRLAEGFAAFRAHARARELQDPPTPGKAGR